MKRGQTRELPVWLILALVAAAIIGFAIYFASSAGSDWFTQLFGSENIDSVINGCNTACSQSAQNAWCSQLRSLTVKDDSGKKWNMKNVTCEKWVNKDEINSLIDLAVTEDKTKDFAKIREEIRKKISDKLDRCDKIVC